MKGVGQLVQEALGVEKGMRLAPFALFCSQRSGSGGQEENIGSRDEQHCGCAFDCAQQSFEAVVVEDSDCVLQSLVTTPLF